MKIKNGFVLRELFDSYIIVPTDKARLGFNGMVSFNETGAFIWRSLEQGLELDEIVSAVMLRYDVDGVTAARDVNAFCAKLSEAGLVE